MRSIIDAVAASGGGTGHLSVVGADGGTVTMPWSAVHERSRRVATVLDRDCDAGPGARVGLLGETSPDLVTALQAVWLAGAAVTVLPQPNRPGQRTYADRLTAIVADARLDAVIADPATAPPTLDALGAVTKVVQLPDLAGRARTAAPIALSAPDPEDLAVLQYTSGSTAEPRGVPVSHANLAANLRSIGEHLATGGAPPRATLSWLPLYHDMGLVAFCALPMAGGWPLVLLATKVFATRPASWFEAVTRYRATATGAPNFAYRLMTRLLNAGLGCDLSSLRVVLSGGEPINAADMTAFAAAARRRGLNPRAVTPAYGLAEATLAVCLGQWDEGLRVDHVDAEMLQSRAAAAPPASGRRARRLVRLGRPLPGTEVRVVDTVTGELVAPGVVGHVEVRGPSVVGRYWGEPPAPHGAWTRTGDLGYLTGPEPCLDLDGEPRRGRAGELVVCGRAKEVLFAAGRNVFPQDAEVAAATVAGVRPGGVVAFGLTEESGDRLVLCVESQAPLAGPTRAAVSAAVAAETGLTPAEIAAVPPGWLPRTSSGKPRRAEARRRYLRMAERPGPPARLETR